MMRSGTRQKFSKFQMFWSVTESIFKQCALLSDNSIGDLLRLLNLISTFYAVYLYTISLTTLAISALKTSKHGFEDALLHSCYMYIVVFYQLSHFSILEPSVLYQCWFFFWLMVLLPPRDCSDIHCCEGRIGVGNIICRILQP